MNTDSNIPEFWVEEKRALAQALNKLRKEGFEVEFPTEAFEDDGLDIDYEPDIALGLLKDFRKAKRLGLDAAKVTSGAMNYEEMMKLADLIDSALCDYDEAQDSLREEFRALRDDMIFTRLPNAKERQVFSPLINEYVDAGKHFTETDVAVIAYEAEAEYLNERVKIQYPDDEGNVVPSGKRGCLGTACLTFFCLSVFAIFRALS